MWVKGDLDDFDALKREVDRTFRQGFGAWAGARRRVWRPPTDVYETDSHMVVRVEIAGMLEADFRICLSERTLSIMGSRSDPAEKLAYQQMEISYGDFVTEVYLPSPPADASVEAVYEEGFLTVSLPKASRTHVRVTRT